MNNVIMESNMESTINKPRTHHFQGLEVSKPSAYKSLNASSSLHNSDDTTDEQEHEHHAVYTSLINKLSKLFVI